MFLALSSLSFFQKSDDETAFQIPPRDARARARERESKEKERDAMTTIVASPSFAVVARVIKTLGRGRQKDPNTLEKERKDPHERERERMNETNSHS